MPFIFIFIFHIVNYSYDYLNLVYDPFRCKAKEFSHQKWARLHCIPNKVKATGPLVMSR